MAAKNLVILIGNVSTDIELRYTQSGAAVANFNLATNERWTTKDGEKKERTEFHRIVIWGRLAEVVSEYCGSGSLLYLEGRNQTRSWEDKDGNKRYTTEVIVNQMQILGGRKVPKHPEEEEPVSVPDDDIPF